MIQDHFNQSHVRKWARCSIKQQSEASLSPLCVTHYCKHCDDVKSILLHLRFMCFLSCSSLASGRARPIKLTLMDMCSSILSPPLWGWQWGRPERTQTYAIVLWQPLVLLHSRLSALTPDNSTIQTAFSLKSLISSLVFNNTEICGELRRAGFPHHT